MFIMSHIVRHDGRHRTSLGRMEPSARPGTFRPLPHAELDAVTLTQIEIRLKIAAELAQKEPDLMTAEDAIQCLKSIPKLDLPSVYEIEEPIGEGEFARCFRARDQLLGKTVIIKVLHTPLSNDSRISIRPPRGVPSASC